MKKIIFYNPSFETGGVEKNIISFLGHLDTLSKYVPILVSTDNIKIKLKKKKYTSIPKIKINLKFRFFKYILSFFYLVRICFQSNCIILSFQNNIFALIASIITNTKIIVRLNTSPEKYVKSKIIKTIFKFIYKKSDIILVNDEDFKKSVKLYFGLNARIVHNCVDIKKINQYKRSKIKFSFFKKNYLKIISVGRLTLQKDHMTLIKAVNNSKKKNKFRVLILGSGDQKKNIVNYIKQNNLEKIIKISEYKQNPYKYINQSNLFVLPSKYEGSPNILLEVAALKKLIISTNCRTGPRMLLANGKGGHLFKVGDYKQLSKILDNVQLKSKLVKKKINHSFGLVKKYSVYRQKIELLNALKKIEN
mgnify:CR=1 FL=1|tara:strand:+ start:1 stop:1089 length:1089 start_codon:yes stop_codon:yes gene_type:complete